MLPLQLTSDFSVILHSYLPPSLLPVRTSTTWRCFAQHGRLPCTTAQMGGGGGGMDWRGLYHTSRSPGVLGIELCWNSMRLTK